MYGAGAVRKNMCQWFPARSKHISTLRSFPTREWYRNIRFLFAILAYVDIGGYNQEIDFERLGGVLVIGACLILAIRTARRAAVRHPTASDRDLDSEVDYAVHLAGRVISHATSMQRGMFRKKDVPWYIASDEDQPK